MKSLYGQAVGTKLGEKRRVYNQDVAQVDVGLNTHGNDSIPTPEGGRRKWRQRQGSRCAASSRYWRQGYEHLSYYVMIELQARFSLQ